ncbi:MAG TPA: hypothetical protein DD653_08400 [Marinilabiliales bacterium]|nr:hypothetical protein [Marinilabiliales bacterium]
MKTTQAKHLIPMGAIVLFQLWPLFIAKSVYSQASTTNYSFTASSTGTLTNMSSGTTTLINPDVDGLNTGTFSVANDIGFSFYFMGQEYTQFVATEDGVVRLGTSLSPINRVPELGVNEPRLVPFSCDMRTGNNGKVHYKIMGSAPNRVFVIEWSQMIIAYTLESQAGKSTFQMRLYETSNQIEYVYGYMYADVHRTAQEDYGAIGFCSSNASNGVIYKMGTFNNSSVARTVPATALLPTLISSVGEISGLSSTSDSYRMLYRFTPISAPAAPLDISFSGITYSDFIVNWTDNSSNEAFFLVYLSEDGGATYSLVATTNANTTNATINGLPSKNYYVKIVAVNEGGPSSALIGSTSTLAAGTKVSNTGSGNWSDPNTWLPIGVPANTDDVTILDGDVITIDNTSAVCNNLIVGQGSSGVLQFIGGTANAALTTDGDVTVSAGGTFDVNTGATSGTRTLVIGNRQYSNSNLTVNGDLDMYIGSTACAGVEFKGLADGSISGSGSTCDFYTLTVNKGTSTTAILDVTREITIESPTSAGNRLVLTNGTFKLSSASTISPYYGSTTLVSSTGRLWLNHSGATIQCVNAGTSSSGSGNATIDDGGILQITAGTFSYGAGSNTLTVNGTLKLESASATLNQFGRFYLPNTGYLIMYAGNINMDPRAVSDLSNHVMEFGSTAFVLAAGGTITLVDPVNSTSYNDFVIPSAGEQNKSFLGSTLQLGDGSSTMAGTSRGFVVSFPTRYKLSLGNIVINNPSGTNRHVSFNKSDSYAYNLMIQNLTIQAGTFRLYNPSSAAYTVDVFGHFVNNGTLDASVSTNRIQMIGSAAQNISGTGAISAANNLQLQISNSKGVTLQSPITANMLVLTNGKLNTDATNILTLLANTNTGSGSASSYVNGPLKRILPSGTNTVTFPVGDGTYNMLELVDAVTTTATVEVVAEVVDENCQGSYTNGDYILNSNRYWKLNLVANASNLTSSSIRVTEVGTTSGQLLTKCTTINGTYSTFSDGSGTSGYTILSNAAISGTDAVSFFAIASNYLTGTYSIGSGQSYTSLTGATGGFFAAVNSTGLRGNVIANITSDLTETGEVALNQWNEANGSGYSITFQPSTTATRTISGSVNRTDASGPGAMIRFNGADRVIVDGTTSKYLQFKNNTTNAGNTSATFEILGNATGVQIKNSIIENHNNTASTQGVITLGSGDNTSITVSGNEIRNATSGYSGYPYHALYSNNSGNSLLTISDNYIYNFGNYGICFQSVGDGVTLSGNHFYKTLTDDLSGISQIAVYINGGNSHTISGNFIGGQATSCGGAAWTNNASSSAIKGIVLDVESSSLTTVKDNSISNFNVQSTSGTSFVGIQVEDGSVSIGNSEGNTVSNITTKAATVYGIQSDASASVLITNNSINSINATGTDVSTVLHGIVHSGTASANISNNTIFAFDCSAASTDIINQTVSGIYCSAASNQPEIQSNTIYNLLASNTGAVQTNVSGIAVRSSVSAIVAKNKIYDLRNSSTSTDGSNPPTASGIVLYHPATGIEVSNNQIVLGNSQTTNTGFYGIWMNGQPGSSVGTGIFYNSIVIDGTVSSGSLPSYSLLRGNHSTTTLSDFAVDIRNNIFANRRSGGSGNHYAIGNQGTNPTGGWGSAASNYNLYSVNVSGDFGYWNVSALNFANWKTTTASDQDATCWISTTGTSDAENLNLTQLFTNISAGDLSIITANTESWAVNGAAQPLTEVSTDFSGTGRSTLPSNGATDCGAFEITPSSEPMAAIQTGTITDGNTTTYSLAGRTLATIAWHGANFPSSIAMRYYPGMNPTDDGESTLASTNHSNSFWRVTPTGGTLGDYTYDLTLFYNDNILSGITDEASINIAKNPVYYPTASDVQNVWRAYHVTASDASNDFVAISGIIGFSDFALDEDLGALPIQLTHFEAVANGRNVVLWWETATETNNQYFTIEKAVNMFDWIKVADVQGAGNSLNVRNYQYTDEHPIEGISYYRLKQTDFDGEFTYSKVRSVRLMQSIHGDFDFYYDAADQVLVFENLSGNEADARLEIFNFQPSSQLINKLKLVEGSSKISVSQLPVGVYMAVLHSSLGTFKLRFVKK